MPAKVFNDSLILLETLSDWSIPTGHCQSHITFVVGYAGPGKPFSSQSEEAYRFNVVRKLVLTQVKYTLPTIKKVTGLHTSQGRLGFRPVHGL